MIQVSNIYINNIYNLLSTSALQTINHPIIYIGDSNSHHINWGYRNTNNYRDILVEWSEVKGVKLIQNVKQKGTFCSARWNREYNTDLCFISTDINRATLPNQRRVLEDFPNNQHRSVVIEVGYQIQVIKGWL